MSEKIICGDAHEVLKTLESESVDCVITSPPYFGLRDYGMDAQIGLEDTPEAFTEALVAVFREARRVLKKEGTLWVNLGDSYNSGDSGGRGATSALNGRKVQAAQDNLNRSKDRSTKRWGGGQNKVRGLKPKDLIGIPWRVAFALQADGWYLRSDIIWAKKNCMPESVTDRPTRSHEYIFLLSRSPKYYYDADAIKEPVEYFDKRVIDGFVPKSDNGKHRGDVQAASKRKQDNVGNQTYTGFNDRYTPQTHRNKRDVWHIATTPYTEAHFATFPEKLVEPMIMAGCPEGGTVLDPFSGAATTGLVAKKLGRNYIGIELNPEYVEISERRLNSIPSSLFAPQN